MAEWIAMGGYGGYVWTAYGMAGIVLAGLTLWVVGDDRRQRALLDEQESDPL